MHLMVLNALQLVVALAMDNNSQQPLTHSSAAGGRGGERLRQTRMVIDSLIKEVNIVATSVLKEASVRFESSDVQNGS